MQLKRYKKDFAHSYSFGSFPTLELLTHRPDKVLRVVAHSKGEVSEGVAEVRSRCDALAIPFEVNDKLVDKLAHKGNVYVFAVFEKYDTALQEGANHLLLVSPSDMGNLGTIIRTMLGFGVRDLALLRPAADLFNPHVVRASMGAVFALNARYFDSLEAYQSEACRTTPSRQLYPFMLDAKRELQEAAFASPFTLVFGPEGPGLPKNYREVGESVLIPQDTLIESLNLAVAVGIALYEATRKGE